MIEAVIEYKEEQTQKMSVFRDSMLKVRKIKNIPLHEQCLLMNFVIKSWNHQLSSNSIRAPQNEGVRN